MAKAKTVSTPLPTSLRLSVKQSPNEQEKEYMQKVPYASAVGSLMYTMVCTRPVIAHAVSTVKDFFLIQEKSIRMQ
jgi:hypothetical protein